MAIKDLISIDHSFEINLSKVNVKTEDLKKIQRAWAEGHFIYKYIKGRDFKDVGVEIFTVRSKNGVDKGAEEITRSWNEVLGMLRKNEIPDRWVDEAISTICKRMEELS